MSDPDVFPVRYDQPVGQVRFYIPDTAKIPDTRDPNISTFMLSDEQIKVALAINNGSVRRAAADCCEIIGRDDLLIGKVITQTDLATDASKVSAQMLANAKSLREQATAAGDLPLDDDGFLLVPGVPIDYYAGELLPAPWYTGVD